MFKVHRNVADTGSLSCTSVQVRGRFSFFFLIIFICFYTFIVYMLCVKAPHLSDQAQNMLQFIDLNLKGRSDEIAQEC